MGGYFMTVIKMELTPDKNYVWGKLVVQGVCFECLRDRCGGPVVGSWPEKGKIGSPKTRGSCSSQQHLECW